MGLFLTQQIFLSIVAEKYRQYHHCLEIISECIIVWISLVLFPSHYRLLSYLIENIVMLAIVINVNSLVYVNGYGNILYSYLSVQIPVKQPVCIRIGMFVFADYFKKLTTVDF